MSKMLADAHMLCWYGASLGGTFITPGTTSLTDESRVTSQKPHKKHKDLTNSITMVVEPIAPPAAWIL
jgi:hypothetical protein